MATHLKHQATPAQLFVWMLLDPRSPQLVGGGSLGGAKPKAAIAIDGEEWVLKFFNGEPFDLPLAEHATMALAR